MAKIYYKKKRKDYYSCGFVTSKEAIVKLINYEIAKAKTTDELFGVLSKLMGMETTKITKQEYEELKRKLYSGGCVILKTEQELSAVTP